MLGKNLEKYYNILLETLNDTTESQFLLFRELRPGTGVWADLEVESQKLD